MSTDLPEHARLRTAAVHAGEEPDPVTRAATPNLVMSTTFVVDEPTGFSAHDEHAEGSYFYTRWGNPTVRQLEKKLAALEGTEDGRVYASGMAAAAAIVLSVLSAGDRIVTSDVTYPGVAELIRNTLPRFGIEVDIVDASDLDAVAGALERPAKLVWLESPANPIMRLTDLAAVTALAHRAGAEVVADSTFSTPVATRPAELGVDYVMHSLTKYIGGHGDAVGGAVLANRDRLDALSLEATFHHGGILSPFNAWLILRGVATLPIRMEAHQAGALAVARALEGHPAVKRVMYPGLESHPQHQLAKAQMRNFSGMLTFQVDDGGAVAERMMKQLRLVHYAVSLGHHRSLIYWLPTDDLMESTYRMEGAALDAYRAYAGDGVFRVSVGIEDPDDVVEDLLGVL